MLLEVNNLIVHYAKAEALKGISLQVAEGEIVSIIGANGAGKTTLLRVIAGLKKATSGKIWFLGKSIAGLPTDQIVKMGIALIPAGRMIFAPMTVLDNIKTGAYIRKDRAQIARDLEEIYTHFPVLKKRPRQIAGSLSGGEQQMLAIARALMTNPKLLLMDEPSIGLSPILVAEVAKIISEIHRTGISIILVEQNARIALRLAKRAYILELGKIALEGNTNQLVNDERVKRAYLGIKAA